MRPRSGKLKRGNKLLNERKSLKYFIQMRTNFIDRPTEHCNLKGTGSERGLYKALLWKEALTEGNVNEGHSSGIINANRTDCRQTCINITITILDIIHRPVFYLKHLILAREIHLNYTLQYNPYFI
jgi:hypothetical protein